MRKPYMQIDSSLFRVVCLNKDENGIWSEKTILQGNSTSFEIECVTNHLSEYAIGIVEFDPKKILLTEK